MKTAMRYETESIKQAATKAKSEGYKKMLKEWCYVLENQTPLSVQYLDELENLLENIKDLRSPWKEMHFVRGALKVAEQFGQK